MLLKFVMDIVGLSSETKPTTEDIQNGTTYFEVDTSKLFVYYRGVWYEQQ